MRIVMLLVMLVMLIIIVMAEFGCQLIGADYNIMKTATKKIKSYCQEEKLKLEDFETPYIYASGDNDCRIEYLSCTNIVPRHVVSFFFKRGVIVNVVVKKIEIKTIKQNFQKCFKSR